MEGLSIAISGGAGVVALASLGMAFRAVKTFTIVEERTRVNTQTLSEHEGEGCPTVKTLLATLDQRFESMDIRERQRSDRLDEIRDTMQEISSTMSDKFQNHGDRILKLETKNGLRSASRA